MNKKFNKFLGADLSLIIQLTFETNNARTKSNLKIKKLVKLNKNQA